MTPSQKALWIGALKSSVASITGVIIANAVDSANPVFTFAWFKHIAIQSFFVLLVTEARYWNQWANSGEPRPLPDALADAKDATKQAEAKIEEAQRIAPKE